MYTAPAYFMATVVCITIFFILNYFKDRIRHLTQKDPKRKSQRQQLVDDVANATIWIGLTVYDACILGCMLLNVATKGSIAAFETMGIRYAESHFELYPAKAGVIVATCGTVGVVFLLLMGYLSQHFSDIQLITGGMVIMAAGIVSLAGFHEDVENPKWRYVFAMFLIYAVGYPIGHTALIGLFSKSKSRCSAWTGTNDNFAYLLSLVALSRTHETFRSISQSLEEDPKVN
jgi:ceroid-lipofuscinosis MFS transporter 7